MKEEWRPVKGFEGRYLVSNYGKVFSLITGKKIRTSTTSNGYPKAHLHLRIDKGKYRERTIEMHRLVAEHYLVKTERDSEVSHIDHNKNNNRSDNLKWCRHRENVLHTIECGRHAHGERCGWAKLREADVINIIKMLQKKIKTMAELAREYNVMPSTINKIAWKQRWKETWRKHECFVR